MEEKTVFIGGLKINYKVAGSGPAILVLHGWGSSSDSWIRVQEFLAKEGYFVICPDLPGFGKSDIPDSAWSIKEYEKVVIDFVKKMEDKFDNFSEPFFLLGHSFGGTISIKIASDNSLKLRKLLLCDPAGIRVKPSIKTRIIILISSIGDLFFSLEPLRRIKDLARNFFYSFIKERDYVKATGIMKETIKKILKEDLSLDLLKIKTETLLLWGEKDKIIPLKYSKIYRDKIKNSHLETFSKTGHSPHLSCPSLLAKEIIKFLNKNDS